MRLRTAGDARRDLAHCEKQPNDAEYDKEHEARSAGVNSR